MCGCSAASSSTYSVSSPFMFLTSERARFASPVGESKAPFPLLVNVVWPPFAAVSVTLPSASFVMLSCPPTLKLHCGPSGPSDPAVKCREP